MPEHFPRPDFFVRRDGEKSLPFSADEYARCLGSLRRIMDEHARPAVVLTSMHGIAYQLGVHYCSFGRHYACVVTADACTVLSANSDGSQPWRRWVGEGVIYTDWRRDNIWRAVAELVGGATRLGIEADHLTCAARDRLVSMRWVPERTPGAGRYREHDTLTVDEIGSENITCFPFGPEANIVDLT